MKRSYGSAVPNVTLSLRSQEYKKPILFDKKFYLIVFQGLRLPTTTWGYGHLGHPWPGEIKFREEIGSMLIKKLSWFITHSLSINATEW